MQTIAFCPEKTAPKKSCVFDHNVETLTLKKERNLFFLYTTLMLQVFSPTCPSQIDAHATKCLKLRTKDTHPIQSTKPHYYFVFIFLLILMHTSAAFPTFVHDRIRDDRWLNAIMVLGTKVTNSVKCPSVHHCQTVSNSVNHNQCQKSISVKNNIKCQLTISQRQFLHIMKATVPLSSRLK